MALTQRQRRSERITGPKVSAPASTMVRRRIPELAVGVLLMGLFALGALVLFQDSNEPVSVVAVGTEIAAGQVITSQDLVPIGITSDSLINPNVIFWGSTDHQALVGGANRDSPRKALVDLPVGTFASWSMVAPDSNIRDGYRALGLLVTTDTIPDPSLNAQDRVDLLSVAEDGGLIVEAIEIVEVVGGDGRWFVTLEVPVENELEVATAIANGTLRLARLPR